MWKETLVRNAETFVAACATLKTKVLLATATEIDKSKYQLEKLWVNIVSVKGTQRVHQIIADCPYHIYIKFYASAPAEETLHIALNSTQAKESEEGDKYALKIRLTLFRQ